MIDLNLGGACPRRPLTHALPRAMKNPNAPLDAELGQCDLGVFAANGPISEAIDLFTELAPRSRQSWLIASFADGVTTQCTGLVLVHPVKEGILFTMVEPCLPRAGVPMILVTVDRTRAFAMTATGALVDRAVPRPARVRDGVERGWTELVRRMRALTSESGEFRHESWEIHLMPAC